MDDYDFRITVHLILFFICLTTVFEHNNNVYKFVLPEDDTRTWYEAETLCKTRENGHLTSLVTLNEIEWADGIIKSIVRDPSSKVKLWIGGSDRRINDAWDFVDAQPLRYNVVPWAPGQPRRPLQQAPYEFCVCLEFEGDRSKWYVEDCFEVHGYICKSEGRLNTFYSVNHRERWNRSPSSAITYQWRIQTYIALYKAGNAKCLQPFGVGPPFRSKYVLPSGLFVSVCLQAPPRNPPLPSY